MPGRAAKRERERRRAYDEAPTMTGPNISGWQQLAAMFPDRVQHGGERLLN